MPHTSPINKLLIIFRIATHVGKVVIRTGAKFFDGNGNERNLLAKE